MKKVILLTMLCLFAVGCASTNNPVKKAADQVYKGTQAVDQAVWDNM